MQDEEQAVLVHLRRSLVQSVDQHSDLASLEDRLAEILDESGYGEFDGNEFGSDGVKLFMYGPDAQRLYEAIEPILKKHPVCRGASVVIRPGGPEISGDVVYLAE